MSAIFEFCADETQLTRRLLGRRIHKATNTIHHVDQDTLLEQDPSDFIKREDDINATEISKRMRSYKRFMPQLGKVLTSYCKGKFPHLEAQKSMSLGW